MLYLSTTVDRCCIVIWPKSIYSYSPTYFSMDMLLVPPEGPPTSFPCVDCGLMTGNSAMVGSSILTVSQLTLTHVSRLKECLKNTPTVEGMVDNAHHSVHIVRHSSTSADSAEGLKVVLHHPDVVIGQVLKVVGNSMLSNSVLQLSTNSRLGKS